MHFDVMISLCLTDDGLMARDIFRALQGCCLSDDAYRWRMADIADTADFCHAAR